MPRNFFASRLLALVLAFLCGFTPAMVVAQGAEPVVAEAAPDQQPTAEPDESSEDYFMSDAHRQRIYEQKRKKAGKAVLLSLALPGLGNIYAEQYLVGGLAFIFLAFTGVFLAYGLATQQPRVLGTGIILGVGTYTVSLGTSLLGVKRYNRLLRQGLKVEEMSVGVRPVPGGWGTVLTFRF